MRESWKDLPHHRRYRFQTLQFMNQLLDKRHLNIKKTLIDKLFIKDGLIINETLINICRC